MSKAKVSHAAASKANEAAEASAGCGCGCAPSSCCGSGDGTKEAGLAARGAEAGVDQAPKKVLRVELLVIDLTSCKRCVPTGDQLRVAVSLLAPVAQVLGIELEHHEVVVETPAQAKRLALLSSPTIRLNGRDIAQDIRESKCESCGDLTGHDTAVDCREWHYRGKVYSAAPLPLLVEAIMGAMLKMDEAPVVPRELEELPDNLQRYFADKKQPARCC